MEKHPCWLAQEWSFCCSLLSSYLHMVGWPPSMLRTTICSSFGFFLALFWGPKLACKKVALAVPEETAIEFSIHPIALPVPALTYSGTFDVKCFHVAWTLLGWMSTGNWTPVCYGCKQPFSFEIWAHRVQGDTARCSLTSAQQTMLSFSKRVWPIFFIHYTFLKSSGSPFFSKCWVTNSKHHPS